MKTCIVISTCEKYRALAEFSHTRIENVWSNPPPVFLCGLENGSLPLRDDPRNWMKVTRSACDDLLSRGFELAYVLLDDHPPFDVCHSDCLNAELPEMMRDLDAVSIALSGYGQGRKRFGTAVRWRDWDLDLCLPSTLWKLPLHPAMWNLVALRRILDELISRLPETEHTPWAFERKGGSPDTGLPDELISRSYRIDGMHRFEAKYPSGLKMLQRATDAYRFAARKFGGAAAREAVDSRVLGVHHYYHGPYPLFWSGLMRKGAINPDAEFFLMLTGRSEWVGMLRDLAPPR